MNTKMLEQLHCMMYSYTSDMGYENLGGDVEEEGEGRGEVLSLSLSPPSFPPSFPPSHPLSLPPLHLAKLGQLQGV